MEVLLSPIVIYYEKKMLSLLVVPYLFSTFLHLHLSEKIPVTYLTSKTLLFL